jgi:hypothetical protein
MKNECGGFKMIMHRRELSSRNDIGESGGYSPNSATASSCEKNGNVVGDDTRSPERGKGV